MEGNGLVVGQLVCRNRCTSNVGHMLHCITVWLDSIVCPNMNFNGGQKCWDLSSDITKTSDPSPPTPNKVEFGAKWVKLSAFFDHNIARGRWRGWVGDDAMNPKPNKKMSLGAEFYGIIACKGFFTQSQVLLSSIVVPSIILVYVHTLPKSFCAGTKTIPNRASLHT